jgi:hypothetical protein
MIVKGSSKSSFIPNESSVCAAQCPAHIKMIFDFMPNILQYSPISFCSHCLYAVLQVVQGYRHWQNINFIFHKAPQEKVKGVRSGEHGGQEADPVWPVCHSGNCLFRMFSPHCGCVVVLITSMTCHDKCRVLISVLDCSGKS